MEFEEVIKQKQRMCNRAKDCGYCPLDDSNNGFQLTCRELIEQRPEEAEKIIMKWAEEHPKANVDRFNEIFPDYPMDISEVLKDCRTKCDSFPHCANCNRKKAIDFWEAEYKEVS